MTETQKLFGIRGRMCRSQYWGYTLVPVVVFCAVVLLSVPVVGIFELPEVAEDLAIGCFTLILMIPLTWISICVAAKRSHDRDRSGWFQLIALVPVAGLIWLVIELGFREGTAGDNRFGDSPGEIAAADLTVMGKLFGIRGRMRRRQYWGYSLVTLAAAYAVMALGVLVIGMFELPEAAEDVAIGSFGVILTILLTWITICVAAKRCHDRDRSGWFQLIALVPVAGLIWLGIELGVVDGTAGDNRFGPSPKGIVSGSVSMVFA